MRRAKRRLYGGVQKRVGQFDDRAPAISPPCP